MSKKLKFFIQEDALELQKAIEYDDEGATHFSSVDDEYKYGGVEDPKVLFKLQNCIFKPYCS